MREHNNKNQLEYFEYSLRNNKLIHWIAAIEALLTFALVDAAVIVWTARLISAVQLFALAITYALIASGMLFTAYQLGNTQRALAPVPISQRRPR